MKTKIERLRYLEEVPDRWESLVEAEDRPDALQNKKNVIQEVKLLFQSCSAEELNRDDCYIVLDALGDVISDRNNREINMDLIDLLCDMPGSASYYAFESAASRLYLSLQSDLKQIFVKKLFNSPIGKLYREDLEICFCIDSDGISRLDEFMKEEYRRFRQRMLLSKTPKLPEKVNITKYFNIREISMLKKQKVNSHIFGAHPITLKAVKK